MSTTPTKPQGGHRGGHSRGGGRRGRGYQGYRGPRNNRGGNWQNNNDPYTGANTTALGPRNDGGQPAQANTLAGTPPTRGGVNPNDPNLYINTIAGGSTLAGSSGGERKRYARATTSGGSINSLGASGIPHADITFRPGDSRELITPHTDPLVVHAVIATKIVKRIMVDTGASVDILYYDAFAQLDISPAMLQPYAGKLTCFSGNEVDVAGLITLDMTLGDSKDARRSEPIEFTVVRLPSIYNAIMGRTSLMKFQAVASILKFPVEDRVGVAHGQQIEARARCRHGVGRTSKAGARASRRL